ncbi:hypothetical protein TNCV_4716831 [Trichonephila clavipes]|nr:hypothetical protein TNCV_4716831 [Trichonephila clavipes]
MLSEKFKALLEKLFFMNKESATIALSKLRLQKRVKTGKEGLQQCIQPYSPVCGVMLYDSKSSVVILHTCLTAQRYVDAINARCNTTRIYLDCFRVVNTLPWPALSPDFSPIEHAWDI